MLLSLRIVASHITWLWRWLPLTGVVETSVTNNGFRQNYSHPDDNTIRNGSLTNYSLSSWKVGLCCASFDVSSENFWIHQDNILRWTSTFNKNTTQCCACIATINFEEIVLENRLFPVTRHYNWAKSILFTCTESWYRGLEWTTHSGVTVRQIFHQQILDWDWLWMTKGHVIK